MKSLIFIVVGLATLGHSTSRFLRRLARPIRVMVAIARLRKRGLRTTVHHTNGHVLVHVYDVALKDVLVF